MTADDDRPKSPEALIARIQGDCRGRPHVFRGTNRQFDEISSKIYRGYRSKLNLSEHYQPIDIERDVVDRARVHFPHDTPTVDILTDLRHFGGDTTLIDFSRDLLVALYFACDGDIDNDGELFAFPTDGVDLLSNIADYGTRGREAALLQPARTERSRARVEFQSSIFVHAPDGFISKSRCKTFCVPSALKKQLLQHLRDFHNIHRETIYNDLIGFIQDLGNFKAPMISFYCGHAAHEGGDCKAAIEHYDEAVRLKPDFVEAYNNRGGAKADLGCFEGALADYDEAIRLKPDLAEAYFGRGNAKQNLHRFEDALADYDEAIRIKPDLAGAYLGRDIAKKGLGR